MFKNKIKTIEEFSNSGYDRSAPDEAWILSIEEVTEVKFHKYFIQNKLI